MEIMGGLIKLDRQDQLPIPWYIRGHLGLHTGSRVWCARTDPRHDTRRLPDIIVSPLEPQYFHLTTAVSLAKSETIGALADVIREVHSPANIAVADSVTIEGRHRHQVDVVIEPLPDSEESFDRARKHFVGQFNSLPGGVDFELSTTGIYPREGKFMGAKRLVVANGLINIDSLLESIRGRLPDLSEEFDFQRLVVSSNPARRIVRYIIPRKGVVTLSIPHQDRPGVLLKILDAIKEARFNILCSRLSRVPPRGRDQASTFVAECEPSEGSPKPGDLLDALAKINGVDRGTPRHGTRASKVLYLNKPGTVSISPPREYHAPIDDERRAMRPKGGGARPRAVFVSRRLMENRGDLPLEVVERFKKILRAAEKGIARAGWVRLQAAAEGAQAGNSFIEKVYPRMWVADALMVLAFDENAGGTITINQGQELGFAMGQSKATAILVEEMKDKEFSAQISNYAGRQLLTYARAAAFDDDDEHSIATQVCEWLQGVAKALRES